MDEQVEIIRSNKGGLKLIHKGYMYTVHKKRQCGGIRWRCALRSLHCRGSISTGLEHNFPKFNMPHNHLPDYRSAAAAAMSRSSESIQEDLETVDAMPLQERLETQKMQTQPVSPTKLKVTRNTPVARAPTPPNEEMCLRWNSHHSNMQTAFPAILSKEQYVDCTLAAEGKTLKCHKLILSSCSPYFDDILSGVSANQHPVLFMKDIPFWILKSLCDFMYSGEVHICQDRLEELLSVAEALKIKGLARKQEQKKEDEAPKKDKSEEATPAAEPQSELDPLDLLEPMYEENENNKTKAVAIATPSKQPAAPQQHKKVFLTKKIVKKKKYVPEPKQTSLPPPIFSFRKGTRSRPNVKIPKIYHADYAVMPTSPPPLRPITPPGNEGNMMEITEIKTEPIDVEDNALEYNEPPLPQKIQIVQQPSAAGNVRHKPIIISNASSSSKTNFKRIKLTRPVISQVQSAEKNALEVIKIPQDTEETNENIQISLDHLQKEAMKVVNLIPLADSGKK